MPSCDDVRRRPNISMGLIFEDLIRRFNEAANETAGDHFTPREVIRLMVNLLLEPDSHILTTPGIIATVCDPGGTGGMLSEAQNWIREHNDSARVLVYGQDYNARAYAVAAADLLIKGQKDGRIEFGNTLIDDKNEEAIGDITCEHSSFRPSTTSKLFDNADFGYRRITVERPLRLRFQMTTEAREQFLDAVPDFLDAVLGMEQALGHEAYDDWNEAWERVQHIAKEHGAKWTTPSRKLFRQLFSVVDPTAQPVIAKRGLRESLGKPPAELNDAAYHALFGLYPETPGKGAKQLEYEADPALRDNENVPLKEEIVTFLRREVQPFVPDAWIDRASVDEKDSKIGKVGYEINFNRVFFRYQPPRPLAEIDAELAAVEQRILDLLREVTE